MEKYSTIIYPEPREAKDPQGFRPEGKGAEAYPTLNGEMADTPTSEVIRPSDIRCTFAALTAGRPPYARTPPAPSAAKVRTHSGKARSQRGPQ